MDAPVPEPEVAALALAGLTAHPKTLPARLFYDGAGCALFYRITELPEYYLTRTELGMLPAIARAVADAMPAPAVLVEYGASEETKAGFLLDRDRAGAPVFSSYVPIDIAAPSLAAMRARLARARPGLAVWPIAADFQRPPALPDAVRGLARLGFFPGSTIGNLEPAQARDFLRGAAARLGEGARMLVGVDLRKDAARLLAAYDDAAGVTPAFNRNLLVRLNREAGADYDPLAFDHRAVWNAEQSRIEMHLASRQAQRVRVAGRVVEFAAGETIHTENSYKHAPDGFAALAASAGWRAERRWIDPERWFSVHLLAA
ncbi:MAG: L-histidine N(alpha)-methyltransferase [Rhodospirillales bacterium]|nr:L-histidine N(alpha)-methyltransferase [Rhodospirillales bacterium]